MKNIPLSLTHAAVAATLSLVTVAPAAVANGSRAPLQDTFVNSNDRGTASGSAAGIIVGNGREGCMMFDVSGLAGVTSARLKLYITQCGATAGVVWPVYVRVMLRNNL